MNEDRGVVKRTFDKIYNIMTRLEFFTYEVKELEFYEPKKPEVKGCLKLKKYLKSIMLSAIFSGLIA